MFYTVQEEMILEDGFFTVTQPVDVKIGLEVRQ